MTAANKMELCVAIFMVLMTVWGIYKGFIRMVFSMLALVATTFLVRTLMPTVSDFVRTNTQIHQTVRQGIENVIAPQIQNILMKVGEGPFAERDTIQNLQLPPQMKNMLIENNQAEIYELLGVTKFTSYISGYLAEIVIKAAEYIILFLLISLAMKLLIGILDRLSGLPLLNGLNRTAGGVLGLAQALFYIWLAGLALMVFPNAEWSMKASELIAQSPGLTILYNCNILQKAVFSLIRMRIG